MRKLLLFPVLGILLACTPLIAVPAQQLKAGVEEVREKFAQFITDDLKLDRTVLDVFHNRDYEERYIEAEDAYHHALADLEDYQNGDPAITQERLQNDAQEVWFDLAPYREILDAHPGLKPQPPSLKKPN